MAMGRKNLFNDFIKGNPKLILTRQDYAVYLRYLRFLTTLLKEEPSRLKDLKRNGSFKVSEDQPDLMNVKRAGFPPVPKSVLLEEPGGWFPNISSSEASPFFCVDKGKIVMYILASSKYVIFQSRKTRSRFLRRSEKTRAGIFEQASKVPAFFVGVSGGQNRSFSKNGNHGIRNRNHPY